MGGHACEQNRRAAKAMLRQRRAYPLVGMYQRSGSHDCPLRHETTQSYVSGDCRRMHHISCFWFASFQGLVKNTRPLLCLVEFMEQGCIYAPKHKVFGRLFPNFPNMIKPRTETLRGCVSLF